MRLKYVTFTGVDTRTDINRLKSIQEELAGKSCEFIEIGT